MTKWTPQLRTLARIILGLLMLRHGMEQVLGFPAAFTPVPTASLHGLVKVLAFPAGILLMLGLFTRAVYVVMAPLYVLVWIAGPLREAFSGPDIYLGVGQMIVGRGPTPPLLLPAVFFVYLYGVESRASWTPQALGVLRIVTGLLFLPHGIDKFVGRGPITEISLPVVAGVLESVGGPLIAIGLFTRPVAFLLSGEMAFAYFLFHAPAGFWGSFRDPNQEASIVYCFLYLFISAAGPGSFSVDGLLRKRQQSRRSLSPVPS